MFLLNQSLGILESLRDRLNDNQDIQDRNNLLVGLCWQSASVLCFLRRYDEASTELENMRRNLESVSGHEWSPRQRGEYQSKYFFLSGELAYVLGNAAEAHRSFIEGRTVDERIGDRTGVAMYDLRLQLFANPR